MIQFCLGTVCLDLCEVAFLFFSQVHIETHTANTQHIYTQHIYTHTAHIHTYSTDSPTHIQPMTEQDTTAIKALVSKTLPELDEVIVDYVANSALQCPEEEQDAGAWSGYLQDAIGPLLAEGVVVVGEEGEEGERERVVVTLCDAMADHLRTILPATAVPKGDTENTSSRLVPLNAPIHMQEHVAVTLLHDKVDLTHVASGRRATTLKRPNAQNIDQARLKRLEAKAKLKLERREREKMALELKAAALRLDALGEEGGAGRSQPQQHAFIPAATGAKEGRVRDVRVENFDISFAGKRILTDATLMLAHGRRYGLVGRNGEVGWEADECRGISLC